MNKYTLEELQAYYDCERVLKFMIPIAKLYLWIKSIVGKVKKNV